MPAGPVVAVINTSPDVVELLRNVLQSAGYVAVSSFTNEIRDGAIDVERFIRQHDPKVIIYDVAPPYEANWRLFEHIRSMPAMRGRFFVITTTNARHVEHLAGRDQQVFEVVGKPLDLDAIVAATRQALNARTLDA
jgi:CheY-like chemotaxis protein